MDSEILHELRLIRGLLVAQLTHALQRGDQTQRDGIALLSNAGLEPREIAPLLSTTPNAVSVALVKLRKEGLVRAKSWTRYSSPRSASKAHTSAKRQA